MKITHWDVVKFYRNSSYCEVVGRFVHKTQAAEYMDEQCSETNDDGTCNCFFRMLEAEGKVKPIVP